MNKWLTLGVTPPEIAAAIRSSEAVKPSATRRKASRGKAIDKLAFLSRCEEVFPEGFTYDDLVTSFNSNASNWRKWIAKLEKHAPVFFIEYRRNPFARGAAGKIAYRTLKPDWRTILEQSWRT
jgi:hypothetical protein